MGKSDNKYSQSFFGFFGLINLYVYENYGINFYERRPEKKRFII